MARHRATEHVGAARRHARDLHRDLNDLLLIEDHAHRVLENRLQQRVCVRDRLATLLAPDVRMHRVALDRPGPDDRDLDHQVVEARRPCARKGLHLRAGLDLEHADGVGLAAHIEHLRVVQRQLVEVGANARLVANQLQRLGDDRERAQPEHVHLDEAKVFDVVLVELDDAASLHRRRLNRHDVHQRLAGDQHPAVVDRKVTREVLHLAAQRKELLPALRPHVGRRHRAGHRVLDVFGEPTVHAFGQPVDELG